MFLLLICCLSIRAASMFLLLFILLKKFQQELVKNASRNDKNLVVRNNLYIFLFIIDSHQKSMSLLNSIEYVY